MNFAKMFNKKPVEAEDKAKENSTKDKKSDKGYSERTKSIVKKILSKSKK